MLRLGTWLLMWIVLLALAAIISCAKQAPPVPSVSSFVVTGRLSALFPVTSLGERRGLVITPEGRAYRMWITRLTQTGQRERVSGLMSISGGEIVTAWCRAVGADTVADSMRVDRRP